MVEKGENENNENFGPVSESSRRDKDTISSLPFTPFIDLFPTFSLFPHLSFFKSSFDFLEVFDFSKMFGDAHGLLDMGNGGPASKLDKSDRAIAIKPLMNPKKVGKMPFLNCIPNSGNFKINL